MLRRFKISTRVNVLIGVPLVALVVLALVSAFSLQTASVRGDEYKSLKQAQELKSAVLPPSANLLEAWTAVLRSGLVASLNEPSMRTQIEAELVILGESEARYQAAVDRWAAEKLEPEQQTAFTSASSNGVQFFKSVNELLIPQLQDIPEQKFEWPAWRNQVLEAVKVIERSYTNQQVFIQTLIPLTEKEASSREQSTDSFVSSVQKILIFAVIGLLAALLLIAYFVRRSIIRPILALSAQARRAAKTDLPEAVRLIQTLPADAPMPTIEAFHTETRDELADLSHSFNSVQNAALDLASEQAVARRVVSENLVNIARRTQSLLGRSLSSLSDMEESERDPATLDKLFRLDHLTTRMRRNAQSLLVLADAEQTRLWSAPVLLGDIVRGALSEIENYARVDLGDLGDSAGVKVQGSFAPDVAHLLAELLENATAFSSPNTRVTVVGRSIGSSHQLAIVDYGIGMTQAELDAANENLRRRSDFGTESSKVLGFQVVSKIANRLGIKVVLASTAGATGITAIVKLPPEVLESRAASVTGRNGARAAAKATAAAAEAAAHPAPAVYDHAAPQVAADNSQASANSAPSTAGPSLGSIAKSDVDARDTELWAMANDKPVNADVVADNPFPAVAVPAPEDRLPVAEPAAEAPAHAVTSAPAVPAASAPLTLASNASVQPVTVPAAAAAVEPVRLDLQPVARTQSGLAKRVRGAQLPDLGAAEDTSTWERPADEIRGTLSSLQRGIDMARKRAGIEES